MDIISKTVERNQVSYPGANRKFGIRIDGINYMLKIADTDTGRLGICSEHIGTILCQQQLKLKTSELRLVMYEDKLSLLSKNWNISKSEQFFPLSSYYEELLDELGGRVSYSYDLFKRIIMNKCPENYDYILNDFWLLHIVDYLTCNTRSAGNFGFIRGDKVILSPIYDCETKLQNMEDQSFKNLDYPTQHMDFGLVQNSSYFIFNNLEDEHKDHALDYAKNHIDVAGLHIDSDIKEESFMLDVISYRKAKLFI